MAGTPQKLEWYQVSGGSTQINGGFGKDSEVSHLFHIKADEHGVLRLHTSLPAKFGVGAYGREVASYADGQAEAEVVLRDFYKILKKQMEPTPRPKAATSSQRERKS